MTSIRKDRIARLERTLKEKLYMRIPGYIFSNDLFKSWIKKAIGPGQVWLDAGCGRNSLVNEFSYLSPNGVGIDEVIHPALVDKSRFIKADLSIIPLESSSVDCIISNMVVEHLANVEKVLDEFHRVLEANGSFIFRTTNKWYPTLF